MVEPDHGTVLSWPVGEAPSQDDVVVMGPRTRARYWHDVKVHAGCVRMRVAPGMAAALLGRPVREIADRAVPLTDFDLDFARLLREMAPAPDGRARLLRQATALFEGSRPEPVHRAARRLHVSERHLRGLFTDAVGLPPRLYTQIDRVRLVLDNPDMPLPDLAAMAGYYDQSHMTAEFRRLMGAPPAAFRAGRWPAPERCGG
ncbi:helix-turn-helix transcriptional regulator [Catenuloplanes sp. NPDC051500]|uniref:helix-turn-helix transcriptional regulator n=1 Tax=Catenuloplanes sp. NPDC051500 TaxID=3363959 RepID=UPI00379F8F20